MQEVEGMTIEEQRCYLQILILKNERAYLCICKGMYILRKILLPFLC